MTTIIGLLHQYIIGSVMNNNNNRLVPSTSLSTTLEPSSLYPASTFIDKLSESITFETRMGGTTETANSQEGTRDYIITFKPETTTEELNKYEQQILSQGGKIRHKYDSMIMKGFAVSVPANSLQALSDHPGIQNVEPDQVVTTQ
ncbi:putative protease inhibitor [Melampsora americana]|nr:putative protease inhibitor [Melampsora americana]